MVLKYFLQINYSGFWHILYVNLSWLIISYHLNFYNFRRYNKNVDVISRLFLQFLIFTFVYFAYYSLTDTSINALEHIKILLTIFISITIFRSIYLFALKKYRKEGGNFRNIILIGNSKSVQRINLFIEDHPELGYKILGSFSDNPKKNSSYLGDFESCFEFSLNNDVDEIYGSLSDLSDSQINKLVDFTDNNLKALKLIPDAKDIFTTKMEVEYYDYLPILSLRKIPFDDPVSKFIKRGFDIIFSLFMMIFVLSWLSPLLYILIKLESKGPLFFTQIRDGLNGETFVCYKYRSMYVNDLSEEIPATKKDVRVTKTGRFLRKTSMDELPQFMNVLLGDMSVVGPRPHMLSETKKYAKTVDKFMVRHFVKPGITGLAQVKGYRGEIEKKEDMGRRIKLDIFYIENWNLLLDLKIIGQTVLNIFKGDDKAY